MVNLAMMMISKYFLALVKKTMILFICPKTIGVSCCDHMFGIFQTEAHYAIKIIKFNN